MKFDFPGLKTLTVLQRAVEMISERGVDIDLLNLPLMDDKTFAMLSSGDTVGVFQLRAQVCVMCCATCVRILLKI